MLKPAKDLYSYSETDNLLWNKLYTQQIKQLKNKAFPRFFELLDEIRLPSDKVPQLEDVSKTLAEKCGWRLAAVEGIVLQEEFFSMLSNKVFPSTHFLRSQQEERLSEKPDIFHEVFGHAVLLLDNHYSTFVNNVGKAALKCSALQREALRRLLWFTMEVGLIQTREGLRIYGGALLSSYTESSLALNSIKPHRRQFDMGDIFRTPFRADLRQKHQDYYYVINGLEDLVKIDLSHELLNKHLTAAKRLGEYPLEIEMAGKYASVNIFE